jgi:hypothetical protein
MAVRTHQRGNTPHAAKFLGSIDAEEQGAMEAEGAVFPASTNTPISEAELKTLKGIRRKLKNKQSAQRSREQEKVRVEILEHEITANAAKQAAVVRLLAENAAMQARLDASGGPARHVPTCSEVDGVATCLDNVPELLALPLPAVVNGGGVGGAVAAAPIDAGNTLPTQVPARLLLNGATSDAFDTPVVLLDQDLMVRGID